MMVGFVLLQFLIKYYGKYNFSDFIAAILNYVFYKTSTSIRASHPPRYCHREPEKKLLAKTMLAAVSLQYPFAHICINIDFTILFFR